MFAGLPWPRIRQRHGLIVSNPCASSAVSPPKVPPKRVVPWTLEQVAAVVDEHPDRYRAVAVVAAGCRLRFEGRGLPERRLLVRRQVKIIPSLP